MENEIWKDVIGYEGMYQVSNIGRVKSISRYITHSNGVVQKFTGRILKQCIDRSGYPYVGLSISQDCTLKKVHRLVATAFIPNPLNLPQINHITGIKKDNSVNNLEWCTGMDNVKHSWSMGLCEKAREVSSKIVINTVTLEEYPSIRIAALKNNVHVESLYSMLRGRNPNKTNLIYKSKYFQNEKPIISTIPYSVNRIITNYARPTQLV